MSKIEITFIIEDDDEEEVVDKPTMKSIKQMEEDKELLEKIKKYGMFNEKGEWMQ